MKTPVPALTRLPLGSILRRLIVPMNLSAVEGRLWLSTGAAALLFALSRPAAHLFGVVGYVYFITQFLAIGLPAYYLGRFGAWGGAVLSALAFLTADLAYGLVNQQLTPFRSDVWLVALTSVVLAVILGEIGNVLRRHRVLPDVLGAFSKQLFTTRDPAEVLGRALRGVMHLVDVDGAAVWLREPDHSYVCVAADGQLTGLRHARAANAEAVRGSDAVQVGRTLVAAPLEAPPEVDGWLVVTRPAGALHRFPRSRMRGLQRLADVSALALSNADAYTRGRASERRLHDLFDSLPSGLAVINSENRLEFVNRQAEGLLGASASDLVGADLRRFVAPDDRSRLLELVAHPRIGVPERVTVVSAAGTRSQTEWVFGPDGRGEKARTFAYFWDAEAMIRREEQATTLAAAVQCLREGVVLADLTGRVGFANPAAARIYGYADPVDMVGQALRQHVPEDRLEGFEERMTRALESGWSDEIKLLRTDHSEIAVHVTTSPVRVEGKLIGSIGVISDLTERLEITARAATADKLATLGRLVAGAAHEINNPLAAILANAELMRVGGAAPREVLNEAVDVIIEESKRAGRIVRDLLSFARQQPVSRATVDLRNLVCDVVALRAGYQKASGIQVTVSADGTDVMVRADTGQLKQVLLNLIVNAEDALRDQPVRHLGLTVSRAEDLARVFVDDSGTGVPEPLRQRIFEPFFTTKPEGQGTGLGLSVSYGIVREHGGHVWVEESPLGGARFALHLPAVDQSGGEKTPAARTSGPSHGGRARNVLIVDDEQSIRLVTQRVLSRFGHTVEVAANGTEALARARARDFDVIICDLRMPEMSGREVYEALVREELLGDAVFTVATGDIADAGSYEFVQSLGRPALLKPFELVSLLDLVNEAAGPPPPVERGLAREAPESLCVAA